MQLKLQNVILVAKVNLLEGHFTMKLFGIFESTICK